MLMAPREVERGIAKLDRHVDGWYRTVPVLPDLTSWTNTTRVDCRALFPLLGATDGGEGFAETLRNR